MLKKDSATQTCSSKNQNHQGNQVPFINKELSKAVIRRSQLETKYNTSIIELNKTLIGMHIKSSKICVLNSDGKLLKHIDMSLT